LHDLFVLVNDKQAHHFTKRSKERIALLQVNYVAALAFGYDTYAYNTYVTPLLRCALQAMATMANEIRTLPAQVRLLLHAALLKLLVAQVRGCRPCMQVCFALTCCIARTIQRSYHRKDGPARTRAPSLYRSSFHDAFGSASCLTRSRSYTSGSSYCLCNTAHPLLHCSLP
jgi:hypothetical protein